MDYIAINDQFDRINNNNCYYLESITNDVLKDCPPQWKKRIHKHSFPIPD